MSCFVRTLKTLLIYLIFFTFLATFATTGVRAAISESEAESKIEEAEMALSSIYIAVLEADKSGADVSTLLIKLNSGGKFLAEAQMHYRNGNFSGAAYYSGLSIQSVKGLVEEAEQLKALAIAKQKALAIARVATSSVAIIVIIFGSVVGWRLFKQRYFEKILEMKPEVVKGES